MRNCKYIVFEGIDGAGKTSLTELLVQELEQRSFNVLHIREPSHYIERSDDNILSTIIFANDRYNQLHDVHFNEYDYVISDRSFYSNLVYQGSTSELRNWIKNVNKYVPQPDIIFLVDVPADVACRREVGYIIQKTVDFLEGCRKRYYNICPGKIVLDGTKPLATSIDYILHVLGISEELD